MRRLSVCSAVAAALVAGLAACGGAQSGKPARDPSRHVVALTFDAGANADAVPSILATLKRAGVPATFFLTGNFVRDFPAAARSIAGADFRIGNHTVTLRSTPAHCRRSSANCSPAATHVSP